MKSQKNQIASLKQQLKEKSNIHSAQSNVVKELVLQEFES